MGRNRLTDGPTIYIGAESRHRRCKSRRTADIYGSVSPDRLTDYIYRRKKGPQQALTRSETVRQPLSGTAPGI